MTTTEPRPETQDRTGTATGEIWIVGTCPECEIIRGIKANLVSNQYHYGNEGRVIVWECENSLNDDPICEYRRVV